MASNSKARGSQAIPRTGPDRVEFRTTPKGIVPSSIAAFGKLTLDPAMLAALTHAGAKLVVEIDAGGTRVTLADQRTSNLIGGPDDLQRLGSIRTFVNRERKEAVAVEAAKEVTQLAFLTANYVGMNVDGFEMRPVDNSYAAAVKPLHAALLQLKENEKKVTDNTSEHLRWLYEPELKRLFSAAQTAYTEVIVALTQGSNIKGLLKERLFRGGVPEWVHSRIVSKTFILERTGDLSKIFFPTDPTKGLALTVREWRNEEFLRKQEPLINKSMLIYTLVKNDDVMRAMTGIAADVRLDDEENPIAARLLSSKLAVMPLVDDATRVIELGSKSKVGFKFPTPSTDTIVGAMVALSTAVLRIYAANLQSVDLVGDYYATIAPNAVSRESVTPTNNFYVQWSKAAHPSAVWINAIQGGGDNMILRAKVWRWIRMELRLSEEGPGGRALARALELMPNGKPPVEGVDANGMIADGDPEDLGLWEIPSGRTARDAAPQNVSGVILRELTPVEMPLWMEFQKAIFPSNGGKKVQPTGVALTALTKEGKMLLSRVAQVSPYVANRMQSWLRSFSDERLQLAAVRVTNAEFDDIFSSHEDEVDVQSEVDWTEQEA